MFLKIHCGDNVNEVWKACKSGAHKDTKHYREILSKCLTQGMR